eukprot:7109441-Pyramimonas_sp.AAC.1
MSPTRSSALSKRRATYEKKHITIVMGENQHIFAPQMWRFHICALDLHISVKMREVTRAPHFKMQSKCKFDEFDQWDRGDRSGNVEKEMWNPA